jgi:hypothetical protein
MIRTREVVPNLYIEVRRSKGGCNVALVDPATREELLIAQNLQDSSIRELNLYIWSRLDRIARTLRTDLELGIPYGSSVARDIYVTGFAALLNLVKNSGNLQVDDVHDFCSRRIHRNAAPPIIEIVAQENDHIFFEIMPLLGKANRSINGDPDMEELTSVITGFNAIIRHRIWGSSSVDIDDSSRISVRFFEHSELPGSVRELKLLRGLEKKGLVRVSLQYPPKGFRAADFPEPELVRRLADPGFVDSPNYARDPGSVCHFSCHLNSDDNGTFLELMPRGWFPKRAKYRIDDIEVALEHVTVLPPRAKLCFLSACKSATIKHNVLLSAMDALRRLKPRSIIGTLGSIPDLTAAQFSSFFYELLGKGWSIGAAELQARWFLLEPPFYNPLGLLFVSYNGEDEQFALPADRRQRYIPDEVSAILSAPQKGALCRI